MAKKRSHGEGSAWKRKNGTWRGQIMDGYTAEGKKKIVNFSGSTKAEVLDQIRDYLNKKDSHVHIDRKMTVEEWGDVWYRDYKSQVQASTYDGYQYTLQLIKKHMGTRKLHEILPIHVNGMQDALVEAGYGISQIRKCRAMLIQIFDAADENGMISSNPARKAKVIRDKDGSLSKPRHLKDAFTEEEIEILRNELPGDLIGHSIRLMLDTGLRVQELIALAPADIAEDGSLIDVNKAVKMVAGIPSLGSPKSKKGLRKIPVPESAQNSARYLRERGGNALIWSLPGKNPCYSVGAFRRRYYNTLKQLDGVRKLSPHCCRHTYVTRLQAKGVSLELVAKLAGHSTIAVTDGYAHTSDDTLRQVIAVLD